MTTQKTPRAKNFTYGRSHKIIYWGCTFDSLLELKYALSIEQDYEFLRSRVHIYYEIKTKKPTLYLREGVRHYTPDFVIRHKETGKAYLVEVKPGVFNDEKQLALRREVAENYIKWKGYDWEYKVIFGDQIKLTPEQWTQFRSCCKLISKSAKRLYFEELNKKFDRSAPSFFTTVPRHSHIDFVMFGTVKSSADTT